MDNKENIRNMWEATYLLKTPLKHENITSILVIHYLPSDGNHECLQTF